MISAPANSTARAAFITNTWFLGIAQLVSNASSYALLFSLTRLGAEVYGLWVLVILLVSYLTPWATLGLAGSLVRFCPSYSSPAHQRAGYLLASRVSFGFSALLALAFIIAARPLAALLIGDADQGELIFWAALLFPLEGQLRLDYAYLQAQERLGFYAVLSSAKTVVDVITLSVIAIWLPSLIAMLAAKCIVLVVFLVFQHFAMGSQRERGGAVPFARVQELKRFLGFGLPMIPASFIWMLIMGVDRFFLERLASLAEVGIYSVADMLALFLLNCTRPINGSLQSRFSVLLSQNPEEIKVYFSRAVKFLAIMLFPGAVGMAMVAEPLVAFVSRPEFGPAAAILPVLCLCYVIIGLSNPLSYLVFLQRGGKVFLILYPVCLGVNCLLNLWLIPAYQGEGAAVATLVSFAVYVVGLGYFSDRAILKTADLKSLALALACSTAMGLGLYGMRKLYPGFDSLWSIPVGVAVYAVLINAVGLLSESEVRQFLLPLRRLLLLLRAPFKPAG